ncbi:MAG: hypothetical protein AB4062_14525 [Crocosphaera sp.]
MLKLKQIIPGIIVSLSFAMLSSVEAATINLDDNGNVMSVDDIELCFGEFNGTLVLVEPTASNAPGNNCPQTPQELEEFFNPPDPEDPLPDALIKKFYDATFALNQFNFIFGDPLGSGFNPSECNDSNPGGFNGLCFWDDSDAARLVVAQVNTAIDQTDPTPAEIAGEVPIPILPNTRDRYHVSYTVDVEGTIFAHKGRNTNGSDPSWALPNSLDQNVEFSRDPFPGVLYEVDMFAQFNFTDSDTTNRPVPPPTTRVPESSSWVAMLVTGGFLILTSKKRG